MGLSDHTRLVIDLLGNGGRLTPGLVDRPVAYLSPQQILETALGLTLSHLWLGRKEDQVGGTNLTLSGTATEGNVAAGLVASNGVTQVAFDFPSDGGAGKYEAPTASLFEFDGTSRMIIALIKPATTNPGVNRQIFGKRRTGGSPSGAGWEVYADTLGRVGAAVVGSSSSFDVLSADVWDSAWHPVGWLVDENAGQWYLASATENGGTNTIPAGDRTTSATKFSLGAGRLAGPDMECALLLSASGAQVEGLGAAGLQALCLAVKNLLVA